VVHGLPGARHVNSAVASIGTARLVALFGAFAFAYFLSALVRAVVATLAPVLAQELQLGAGELGLLAGVYFLGFALMQLPLGKALDRFGPRRVLLVFLSVAVLGCMAFALARGFTELIVARLMIGVGVAACLMAPLAAFRRLLSPPVQLRLNSWMLMCGSLGMLASTVPVQQLLPLMGWRGLFWLVAWLIVLSMLAVAWATPREPATGLVDRMPGGYLDIVCHPVFVRATPLAFFTYGGLLAMQSLWAGPWLTQIAAQTAEQAAQGLFLINLCMLISFLCWGSAMPQLVRRGLSAERLIAMGWPFGAFVLAANIALGPQAGAAWWALWCVATSVITLSQPAVAQAFPKSQSGRALSAFNLVIFAGVFVNQWGIGLVIDALAAAGWERVNSYRAAFGLFLLCSLCSGAWFWCAPGATPRHAGPPGRR
jgi:predicted MFS family arabinose efflux permease